MPRRWARNSTRSRMLRRESCFTRSSGIADFPSRRSSMADLSRVTSLPSGRHQFERPRVFELDDARVHLAVIGDDECGLEVLRDRAIGRHDRFEQILTHFVGTDLGQVRSHVAAPVIDLVAADARDLRPFEEDPPARFRIASFQRVGIGRKRIVFGPRQSMRPPTDPAARVSSRARLRAGPGEYPRGTGRRASFRGCARESRQRRIAHGRQRACGRLSLPTFFARQSLGQQRQRRAGSRAARTSRAALRMPAAGPRSPPARSAARPRSRSNPAPAARRPDASAPRPSSRSGHGHGADFCQAERAASFTAARPTLSCRVSSFGNAA